MVTASSIGRVRACPESEALPHVREASSPAAQQGTAAHEYLYRLHNGEPRDEALLSVPEAYRAYCERIEITPVPGASAEVAMVYDVLTQRARLLDVTGRQYGELAPSEIAGTCDLWVPSASTVVDWKTIHRPIDPQDHVPQLEFYALALARIYRLASVRVEIVTINDSSEMGYPYQAEYDYEDLAAIAGRIKRAWQRAGEARAARADHELANAAPWTPNVTEGNHCTYCPAWRYCPAKRAVLTAVDDSPEATGSAYMRVRDISKWAELAKDRIREAVTARGSLIVDDKNELRFNAAGSLAVLKRKAS